ncbi:inhibitor of Bruton tyrosine kinase, partial [Phenoliferia sp. Uapishka_3]
MNVDLHSLYAQRSLGRARAFVQRTGKSGGNVGAGKGNGNGNGGDGSPGGGTGFGLATSGSAVNAEVNRRDMLGRTVLHLAASEVDDWALEWVELLLGVPGLQVNAVDTESGWGALHRALYSGNIAAARLLLAHRDIDARLKDHEQLSPFDVYNSTVEGTNPSDTSSLANPPRLELFTWGSNRNYVLGFESDGDRAVPERVQLKREEGQTGLRFYEPLRVKDISMARLHTGIVTDEKVDNIRLCGYGTGGRLGHSAQIQFTFAPLPDFPHTVASVALSPDHTVVVTSEGDVYTFGLNRFSQLGYAIESPTIKDEPIQIVPRRVVGALKKEVVLGAAASRTHTAVFTADSLFTWGTNKGQLGYATAGTSTQVMPRKVTAIPWPIIMLTATEHATCVLLATKDVLVLQGEVFVRISFPLARFPSKMQAYRPPTVSSKPQIEKIASCGNTFAALSSLGDVFTFNLDSSTSDSTSAVARTAPKPQRVWSLRRNFTAVVDFGVGLDGSVILCTLSGHVFVRTKKFEASSGKASGSATPPSTRNSANSGNGWKFTRVPHLQRVIKVAANSTGAFAAIRSDVPLRFIDIEGPTLSENLLGILPHWRRVGPLGAKVGSRQRKGGADEDEEDPDLGVERDVEIALRMVKVLEKWDPSYESHLGGSDAFIVAGEHRFPVHRLILAARSPYLATQLAIGDTATLDCTPFTLLLLLHYIYSDDLPAVWDSRVGSTLREHYPTSVVDIDFARTKAELQHLATTLGLPHLQQSLLFHVKTIPSPSLPATVGDLRLTSVQAADAVLELEDGEAMCHSVILRARCSFFETFFEDEDWARERRVGAVVRFNLKHIKSEVMDVVLKHLYLDAGIELFDEIDRPTADEYIDFVTQILAAANELLLDKLKLVCSAVLRSFVTLHNVCAILVDAAFYEANDLVRACLYFLASSMETVLESRLLDDLPSDLVEAVSSFCRERQGARMPISRSGLLTQELMMKHGSWLADLDFGRPTGGAAKWRPTIPRSPGPSFAPSPGGSPRMTPKTFPAKQRQSLPIPREASDEVLTFAMDEDDFALDAPGLQYQTPLGRQRRTSLQAGTSSSPSPSFTPIGSPPPSRLQPWTKVNSVASTSSPRDLRSIMSHEAAANFERPSPLTPPSGQPTPTSSWKPQASSSWRSSSSPRPSLADIMATEQARPSPTPPLPVTSRRPIPAPLSPSLSQPSPKPSPAPVITPSRLGASRASTSGFGAADVPWTNYTVAPPPPRVSPDPFSPFAASVSPARGSFASIQQAQREEINAVKEVKAPRSFQEVMAAEAAEERSRAEILEFERRERAEALEFERWWAEESKRVQAESVGSSGGGGTRGGGAKRGGGRGGRGRGRGGKGPKSNISKEPRVASA